MLSLLSAESVLGSILFLIAGFGLLIKGGDMLVDGAVNTARKFSIPMAFIGLTIVACGTSAPELFTTTYAGLQGKYDIAMTNILGSNIFNICIVIGIASVLFPLVVEKKNFIWDWSWLMMTTLVLLVFSWDLQVKTYEGLILLFLYVAFIALTWRNLKNSPVPVETIEVDPSSTTLKNTLFIILGLIGLVVGTRLALKGGVQVGELMGLSDRFIGLIILAAGTSMPELVTSIVAASKGHNDIAIANVTGSNLANILICLGLSSTLQNYTISERVLNPDVLVVLTCTVLLGALVWIGKYKFKRWQGFTLLVFYGTYFYSYVL